MPETARRRVFDPHITVYFLRGIQVHNGNPDSYTTPHAMEHYTSTHPLMFANVSLHVHHCHCSPGASHGFVCLLYT